MHKALYVLVGLIVFASQADDSLRTSRTDGERLLRDRNYVDACKLFLRLAENPANNGSIASYDCKRSLSLMRKLNRVDEIDGLRERLAKIHAKNAYVLEVLANDYVGDPHHWGYMLNGRFCRGPSQSGSGQPVTCFSRDRAMSIRLMMAAARLAKKISEKEYARLCMATAASLIYKDGVRAPALLETMTGLDELPAYSPGHDERYRMEGAGHDSYVLGAFEVPEIPSSWENATSDGQRWRYLLEEAAKNGLARDAELEWADYLRQVIGVRQLSQVNYVSPERLADACKRLADNETLTVLGGMVTRLELNDTVDYVGILKRHDATDRLSRVYADRGQWGKLDAMNAKSKRDIGNEGQYSFNRQAPRPLSLTTLKLRYRRPSKVSLTISNIGFKSIWDDVSRYLNSNPGHLSPDRLSFGRLGQRVISGRKVFLKGEPKALTRQLPEVANTGVGVADFSSSIPGNGLYLIEGMSDKGVPFRTLRHVTNVGILRKKMVSGVWLQVVSLTDGKPIAGADVNFLGYRTDYVEGRFHLEGRSLSRVADANGQVVLSERELANDRGQTLKWAIYAETEEGLAYLDFSALPCNNPLDQPPNQWRAHLSTDRTMYRPGDVLRYHSWVLNTGYYEPERVVGKGKRFKLIINSPNKKRVYTTKHVTDDSGAFDGSYAIPENALEGRYFIYVPEANATIPFDVVGVSTIVPTVTIRSPSLIAPGGEASFAVKVDYPRPVSEPVSVTLATSLVLEGKSYPLRSNRFDSVSSLATTRFSWSKHTSLDSKTLFQLVSSRSGAFTLEVTTEIEGKAIIKRAVVPIHQNPGKVELKLDRPFHGVGDTVAVRLRAKNHAGVPLKGRGTAVVNRVHASGKRREVSMFEFETNSKGQATVQVPELGSGTYEMTAVMLPEMPNLCFKFPMMFGGGFHMPVRGFRYTHGAYTREDCVRGKAEIIVHRDGIVDDAYLSSPIRIIPGLESASPGSSLPVLILSDRPRSSVAFFAKPALAYKEPSYLDLSRGSTMTSLGVTSDDAPNLFFEAITVGDATICADVAEVRVKRKKSIIGVHLDGREFAVPGQYVSVPIALSLPENCGSVRLMAWANDGCYNTLEYMDLIDQLRPWRRSHYAMTVDSFSGEANGRLDAFRVPGFLRRARKELSTILEAPLVEASPAIMPLVKAGDYPRSVYFDHVAWTPDGPGQLRFKMPESGRDVRVLVWAVGDSGALGEAELCIKNAACASLRLAEFERLHKGDSATCRVVVRNLTNKRLSVTLRAASSSGSVVIENPSKAFKLKGGGTGSYELLVKGCAAGSSSLSVTIEANGQRLTEVREVSVFAPIPDLARFEHRSLALNDTARQVDLPDRSDGLVWAFGVSGLLQLIANAEAPGHEVPVDALNRLNMRAHVLNLEKAAKGEDGSESKRKWDNLVTHGADVMLLVAQSQCRDGGWNWLGGGDGLGDPQTTAAIVHGLQSSRNCGLDIPRSVLFRGIRFLRAHMNERVSRLTAVHDEKGALTTFCDDLDVLVYLALVESRDRPKTALDLLIRDFAKLSLVSQCRLVTALRYQRYYERISPLLEVLYKRCSQNDDSSRKWIGERSVAATAEFLRAMSMGAPGDPELWPYADWLIEQRTTAQSWGGNALDTQCVDALAAFAKGFEDRVLSYGSFALGKDGGALIVSRKAGASPYDAHGSASLEKVERALMVSGQGRAYLSISSADAAIPSRCETGVEPVLRKGELVRTGDVVRFKVVVKVPRALDLAMVRVSVPAGFRLFAAGERLRDVAPFDLGVCRGGSLYFYAKRLAQGQVELEVRLQACLAGTFRLDPPHLFADGLRMRHGMKGGRIIQVKAPVNDW